MLRSPRLEMDFRLLGPLEVVTEDGAADVGSGKRAALLTYLLINANEVVSVERLIDELWGERPPATAAKSVQVYVSQLRKALHANGDLLATRGSGYVLRVADDDFDVKRFEHAVADAQRALEAGAFRAAADAAAAALRLWRGPALDDVAYESFAQTEAARLEELRLVALETRVDADLASGEHAQLVAELEGIVAAHPTRERLRAQLMLALYRCGRQADALEVYREGSRVLMDDLGLEPTPELRELEQKILTHSEELGAQRLWPRISPRREPAGERPRARVRRGARLLVAGGVLLALAAGLVVSATGGSGSSHPIGGNTVAMLDPRTGDVVKVVQVGRTPANVAIGNGAVWVLNADDQTISQIDPGSGHSDTFSVGAIPTGVAAGAGALWISAGDIERNEPGVATTRVLRLDPVHHTIEDRIRLPGGGIQDIQRLPGQIAVGGGAVWVVTGTGVLARIDPARGVVEAVNGLRVRAITLAGNSIWATTPEGTNVVEVDARTARIRRRVPLQAARLDAIAAGAGAVWVADSFAGTLWRISPGGKLTTKTVDVGQGADGVAVGDGAVWVSNSARGTIVRIDPRLDRVSKTISLGETPRAVTTGAGGVWVAVAGHERTLPAATSALGGGPRALPGCDAVQTGADGHYDRLIASDFPIQPTYATPELASRAVLYVLRQHHFRAGPYRIGYQACNTATPQSSQSDLKKCAANARDYVATPAVIGVVGPWQSTCAFVEVPILNRAPGGAVPVVSPSASMIGLTQPDATLPEGTLKGLYPTGVRNFLRVVPTNATQAAGLTIFTRRLRLRRLYLLHDDTDYGTSLAALFRRASRAAGIRLVGDAQWSRDGIGFPGVVRRIRAARADGVLLAGLSASNGPKLVAALRAGAGRRLTIIGADAFAPTDRIYDESDGAAGGMFSSWLGLWDPRVAFEAGARFKRAFQATQIGVHVGTESLYAAAATEALLNAIARSHGTRSSVLRALFNTRLASSPIGPLRFDKNGDAVGSIITMLRVEGGDGSGVSPVRDYTGARFFRTIQPRLPGLG